MEAVLIDISCFAVATTPSSSVQRISGAKVPATGWTTKSKSILALGHAVRINQPRGVCEVAQLAGWFGECL